MTLNPDAMPPLLEFNDIPVMPSQSRQGPLHKGGPIWPNWERQTYARHMRDGSAVDFCPDPPDTQPETYGQPLIWAGPVYWQFGHEIAEYATRILQSVKAAEGGKILFGMAPETLQFGFPKTVPRHFFGIAEWFGLEHSQIMFCKTPLLAKELRVAPQGEQFIGIGPYAEYLDLLDENQARHPIDAPYKDLRFFSRGALGVDAGKHAGSGYIDTVISRAGIEVVHPEKHDLATQLGLYRNTGKLIFTEGSALHALQLLGRNIGEVIVINRRKGPMTAIPKMAYYQLRPRCSALSYHDVIHTLLQFYRTDGTAIGNAAMAVLNTDLFFELFKNLGVDLALHWQQSEYEAARDEDVLEWVASTWKQHHIRIDHSKNSHLLHTLTVTGMDHLVDPVQKILAETA